jgi:DTW domain-containing protein YfiP
MALTDTARKIADMSGILFPSSRLSDYRMTLADTNSTSVAAEVAWLLLSQPSDNGAVLTGVYSKYPQLRLEAGDSKKLRNFVSTAHIRIHNTM